MKMPKYRWLVEQRAVPALKCTLTRGTEFEAPESIGDSLIAQGCAELVTPAGAKAPKKTAKGDK